MKRKISVRPANAADAPIIGRAVAMAIGDEQTLQSYCGEDYLSILTEIARCENTQYSWQNSLVAEVDGAVAGAIIGYDGALLEVLREGTFAVVKKHLGRVPDIANETQPGEYYLDSVGVLPDFRGLGIGKELISAFCSHVFSQGHKRVGLIVDFNNPDAEKLYASLGFKRVGTRQFFEHRMWHLQKEN